MLKQEEEESLMHYLKKEVEAALVRNDQLERQNQELRQEVVHLKSQIAALRAHENERKSMLWKKFQFQSLNEVSKNDLSLQKSQQQQHQHLKVVVPEEASLELLSSRPKLPERTAKASSKFPPAPPPPPSKMLVGLKSIRRVPEVIELYRAVTKKDMNMEAKKNRVATSALASTTDMIGEIENRSTYLSAIKSDVEKQKQLITSLIKEVEFAVFDDISEVETFMKWLDNQLSSLVDERAVLKHFQQWPEQKVDALREAASNYQSLKNLESEVSLFEDNPKEPLMKALAKMQALQDRLERSVNSLEKTRESMIKRYKNFQIPWQWLLNTGFLGQVKVGSLKIAREYMKRISKELKQNQSSEDNLLHQGAKLAYRVHQLYLIDQFVLM
ncbi:Protein CHUP1, chloroplastic [Linum grandiflorum]